MSWQLASSSSVAFCMASLPIQTSQTPQFSHFIPSKTPKPHNFPQPQFTKPSENAKNHQPLSYKSYFHHISSLTKEGQIQQAVNLLTQMEHQNYQIGLDIYGEILQGCVHERDLTTGKQIHARIIKKGDRFAKNEFIDSKLVIFYAKCGVFEAADSLFTRIAVQNVFSWAAIIGLYCRIGLNEEALKGYCEMLENGFFPDNFVVPNALKACGALRCIGFGKGVHGYVVKMGYNACVFVSSSLVDMYGKCGALEDARRLFDSMVEKNVVAWNSMIVSYVQSGRNGEAVRVLRDMRVEGVEPTRVTVSSFLSASANLDAVEEGKQGHAIAVKTGLELDNFLGSSIINFYTKVGLIEDAELVFDRIHGKDVVTWNLLVSGYVRVGQVDKALNACILMRSKNLRFDSVTMASLLSASADTLNLKLGKVGHCFCLRNNLESDIVVASNIIHMYAKCDKIDYARQVFNSMTKRDLILWNTLLAAYADLGMSGDALNLFYQMQLDSVPPNVISWNSVILGFLKNGQVCEAVDFFLQMQSFGVEPNLVTWTILVSGLGQNGHAYEAVLTFRQMQEAGTNPNALSITSVLSACTNVASLLYGKAIHGYITRHYLNLTLPIAKSLADMYVRCGDIDHAKQVFDMVSTK